MDVGTPLGSASTSMTTATTITAVPELPQGEPDKTKATPSAPGNVLNNILGGIGQGINSLLGGNFFRRGASTSDADSVMYNFK